MILKKHFPILFVILFFISCKKEHPNAIASDYNMLIKKGDTAFQNQKYDSAFYYFNNAKEVCADNELERKVYALNWMAEIQKTQSDFIGIEETVTEAFSVNEKSTYTPNLNTILAIAYQELLNYDKAILYYNKALKGTNKELYKIILFNNIAVVHLKKNEYQMAVNKLNPLLKNDTLTIHKKELAKVLDNLGYAFFKLKDPNALSYLNNAMKIRDSLDDDYEKTASLVHLSEYYRIENPKLSYDFALKAYQSATRVNNPDDRLEALDLLIKNANAAEFKPYYLIQSSLQDSILNVRQTAKNQFAKIKFDSTTALKNLEIQKGQKKIYFILLLSTILFGTLLYFLIRSRNRNKLKTISYKTETRISKKLHDELANDVYNTMTFAQTQDLQNPIKKETLIDNLDKIYSRTRNISQENNTINTNEKFETDLKEMVSSYSSEKVNVIIKNDESIQWLKIAPEKKIAIYRVLQELLVNMKKHSEASLVFIDFESKSNTIEINYKDNGVGCEEVLKLNSGLQNAKNRIQTIKGKITFESKTGNGFKSKIIFPQ